MTDTMKLGLILGGVGLLAVVGIVVATRPAPVADTGGQFQPPAPVVQEDATAGTVRAVGGAVGAITTSVIGLFNSREEREAAARRAAADRTALLEDRRYCNDNPNAASCRPAGSNGGSTPARAN